MSKRARILRRGHLAACMLALALCALAACVKEAASPPNVVLITLDTTRVDHLGVYGYQRPVSPEIDRFAREAVVYRRAWATAPWTLPSHASIFTGLYPTTHGAHMNDKAGESMFGNRVTRLGESIVTLAELLRAAGYATAAFAGGPWLSPEFGLLQGYGVQHAGLPAGGRLLEHTPNPKNIWEMPVNRPADELTDAALAWLRSVPRRQPVHVMINYFDPHWPYQVHPGYDMRRDPTLAPQDINAQIDRYDSEIRFMDHHFGRLLRGLRAVGRYSHTLIVVVADHGESFGEHDLVRHGPWLYEELLHVPLLVRFPGGRDGGRVVDTPVSLVDLLPLIARETGIVLPAGVEGLPLGQRQLVVAEAFRSRVFIKVLGKRFDRDLVAAVRWPWKLIVPDVGQVELYRLDEDPGEVHNRRGAAVEQDIRRALDLTRAAFTPPAVPAVPKNVNPATMKRLRALGYLG